MEFQQFCEETVGLFVVKTCDRLKSQECDNCNKGVCDTHTFKADGAKKLCLTCFTDQDTRLTSSIELYSKDRYVWRRKLIQRFHEEYEYMVFMADQYGTLFDTTTNDYYDDNDDNDSFFDS